jgi:hypothetical protein
MEQDPKRLIQKLSDAMVKIEEAAESEIKSSEDYLQVCGALMAVTRNMYERAIGPEQTQQMFLAVVESFNFQEEILKVFKDARPTIH